MSMSSGDTIPSLGEGEDEEVCEKNDGRGERRETGLLCFEVSTVFELDLIASRDICVIHGHPDPIGIMILLVLQHSIPLAPRPYWHHDPTGITTHTHNCAYLNQSPSFHDESILESVHDEPVDLSLGQHRCLTQVSHEGSGAVYHSLSRPGCRNDFHQGDVVRGVDLKLCGKSS